MPRLEQEVILYRNFFAATDHVSIAHTLDAYIQQFPSIEIPDYQQEEFMFNKLFVGPQAPIAPPYASIWINNEKLLMTKETMEVRDFYKKFQLQSPLGMPDDFLALELEAYIILLRLINENLSHDKHSLIEQHLRWLIFEHWGQWLPPFIQKVLSTSGLTAGIQAVTLSFQNWFNQQIINFSHK